jgi:hypothetical protein
VIRNFKDGSKVRFKARLVIKGFKQKKYRDYTETFAPVVRPDIVRLIIALSLKSAQITVQQIDIVTAFLNAKISEDVYRSKSKIVKLEKALYGLKQAPRAWYTMMNKFLTESLGFTKIKSTSCLYFKREPNKRFVIIALYVDDNVFVGDNQLISEVKSAFKSEFKLSDLGPIKKVLGIEVEQDPQKKLVFLSQQKFAEHILEKFGMEHCNPAPTPALPNFKLSKRMCPQNADEKEAIRMETIDYRSAVCSLLFLTHTHPELCYPVSQVAKFVQNPGKQHFQALKYSTRNVVLLVLATQSASADSTGFLILRNKT